MMLIIKPTMVKELIGNLVLFVECLLVGKMT